MVGMICGCCVSGCCTEPSTTYILNGVSSPTPIAGTYYWDEVVNIESLDGSGIGVYSRAHSPTSSSVVKQSILSFGPTSASPQRVRITGNFPLGGKSETELMSRGEFAPQHMATWELPTPTPGQEHSMECMLDAQTQWQMDGYIYKTGIWRLTRKIRRNVNGTVVDLRFVNRNGYFQIDNGPKQLQTFNPGFETSQFRRFYLRTRQQYPGLWMKCETGEVLEGKQANHDDVFSPPWAYENLPGQTLFSPRTGCYVGWRAEVTWATTRGGGGGGNFDFKDAWVRISTNWVPWESF